MTENRIFENLKAAYFTLGCKLNFAETSTIGKQLAALGIRKASAGEKAEICVVNTCSVTELADRKCRQAIRKLTRQHPGSFVIVTGCYAQLKPDDVCKIEGVDLVLGTKEKADIASILLQKGITEENRDGEKNILVTDVKNAREFTPSCSRGDRTRYFLKVQDGCDYYCTYCTIPFARGRSRNGFIADLVRQAEEAGAEGGREIVLTGVNIGDFGKTTGESFIDLIRALDRVESIERFRISSIEPNLLTDEIIEFTANSHRFAPHFHIPLQSGNDEVLRLMHRKYDTALFASKINKIKQLLPDAFIGVDVIVGTRGETAKCFEDARRFIESLPVSQLHVFSYSERPDTQALKIAHAVSPQEKHERSKILLELSARKTLEFYHSQTGTERKILFEHTRKGGKMYGFTENYVKVEAPFNSDWVNRIIPIKLEFFNEEEMCFSC
jgi:threonylcarbamoyladenosine tRNA methylthiotransferase MtaB